MENYHNYLTETEYAKLRDNGNKENEDIDHPPVMKLYLENTSCVWLISKLNPINPELAFGLCDLGMGWPELGYVDLNELQEKQTSSSRLMRDMMFTGNYPMTVYSAAAREADGIVTDEFSLKKAALTI